MRDDSRILEECWDETEEIKEEIDRHILVYV